MSIVAFEGPAGSGKTFSVVEQLRAQLIAEPLLPHQRVLALTFMHGARHRLDEQLSKVEELRGRYEASTLDSLTWRICRRWRGRMRELGLPIPGVEDFDGNCAAAATLLSHSDVRQWVATAFPILLIDEAQDLEATRLGVIEALTKVCCVLLAFDEFQCLNSDNRPVPVESWLVDKCTPKRLAGNKRTYVSALLTAAQAIRQGQPISSTSPKFQIIDAPVRSGVEPSKAAAWIGIRMLQGGSFAILTQSARNKYARDIVHLLRTKAVGKGKQIGPFLISWDGEVDTEVGVIAAQIAATARTYSLTECEALLGKWSNLTPASMTLRDIRLRKNATDTTSFPAEDIAALLKRNATTVRQYTRRSPRGRRAMTIHQAKNREFDHVVVIWPFGVGGSDDDKRRLLYNAVTRAKSSCLIVVQDKKLLALPPFA